MFALDFDFMKTKLSSSQTPPLITVRNVSGTDNLGISGNNVTVKAAGNYIVDGRDIIFTLPQTKPLLPQ